MSFLSKTNQWAARAALLFSLTGSFTAVAVDVCPTDPDAMDQIPAQDVVDQLVDDTREALQVSSVTNPLAGMTGKKMDQERILCEALQSTWLKGLLVGGDLKQGMAAHAEFIQGCEDFLNAYYSRDAGKSVNQIFMERWTKTMKEQSFKLKVRAKSKFGPMDYDDSIRQIQSWNCSDDLKKLATSSFNTVYKKITRVSGPEKEVTFQVDLHGKGLRLRWWSPGQMKPIFSIELGERALMFSFPVNFTIRRHRTPPAAMPSTRPSP